LRDRNFRSLFYGFMLKNDIVKDPLFVDLKDIVADLGMVLCDVKKTMQGTTVQISVVIMNPQEDSSVEDCAKVHNTILPRLQVHYGRDNLYVEVSTPGLQRNFRDAYEFEVFTGKRCRLYCLSAASWMEGVIGKAEKDGVTLLDFEVENSKEKGEEKFVEFDDIQKAKLDYKWEDVKNVRVK
jgi:ribosome maturation factor RimP